MFWKLRMSLTVCCLPIQDTQHEASEARLCCCSPPRAPLHTPTLDAATLVVDRGIPRAFRLHALWPLAAWVAREVLCTLYESWVAGEQPVCNQL